MGDVTLLPHHLFRRYHAKKKNVIDDRVSFQLLHHIAPLVPKVVIVDKGKGTRNSSMNQDDQKQHTRKKKQHTNK